MTGLERKFDGMLRNVLLIATTSGLPLFSKEFLNAVSQPRLIGSLLTAMMEWAVRTTGMPVTYIELTNVAVTIVKDEVVWTVEGGQLKLELTKADPMNDKWDGCLSVPDGWQCNWQ